VPDYLGPDRSRRLYWRLPGGGQGMENAWAWALPSGFGGELEVRDGAGIAGSPAQTIRLMRMAWSVNWDYLPSDPLSTGIDRTP
jgi:hypothetical protein